MADMIICNFAFGHKPTMQWLLYENKTKIPTQSAASQDRFFYLPLPSAIAVNAVQFILQHTVKAHTCI